MLRKMRGFTLIELLIVISVMGILAAIGVVSWNGVSSSSRDRAREQDMRQWSSTFDLYKSRYIVYPVLAATNSATPEVYCLGTQTAATLNRCGQYNNAGYSYADSTATNLTTEVKKVGNAPTNNGPPVTNVLAGPLVYVLKDDTASPTIKISADIINFFENSCPTDTTDVSSTTPYSTLKTGITNSIKICRLHKELTYNPNS